jgi:hypothetical protein
MHVNASRLMSELVKTLLSLSILCILYGCHDSAVDGGAEPVYGIRGRILSPAGEPLPGVKLYCIYYYYALPDDPYLRRSLDKSAGVQSFPFKLYTDLPSPIANSLYLRYSVPEHCTIHLSLVYGAGGDPIDLLNEDVDDGLYQRYFDRLIESRQLKNGIYQCLLSGTGKSGTQYSAQSRIFVVSTMGAPNAVSDRSGAYVFNLKEGFVGDSVLVWDAQFGNYTEHLSPQVKLLVMKDGYISTAVNFLLVNGLLLQQDIVMEPN